MSEPTHEEEFLAQLTTAGVLAARLARAATGQSPGAPADVKALRAAGYTETTPFDAHLRRELGEQRWAWYTADPARIVCAAAITNAARAGHDVPALLTRVCQRRAWEDDQISPARSIARVLDFRIKREMSRRTPAVPPHSSGAYLGRTDGGISARSGVTAPGPRRPAEDTRQQPMPVTPWDKQLQDLLGLDRWNEYAADERRRDVAARLTQAAADGHDVGALLTKAVTCRDWEDDPVSPSRRIAGVLHYRVQGLIASGGFRSTSRDSQLPSEVAQAVSRSTAPARDPHDRSHPVPANGEPPRPRTARPQPDHGRG
jgi:hypothetical protein